MTKPHANNSSIIQHGSMAASAATKEALWQAILLLQLGMRVDLPITLFEDNKSAIMFADHPGENRTTKHSDTKDRCADTNLLIKE